MPSSFLLLNHLNQMLYKLNILVIHTIGLDGFKIASDITDVMHSLTVAAIRSSIV